MGKGRASFITNDLSPATTKSSLDSSLLSPLGDSHSSRNAPDSAVSTWSASSHASVPETTAAKSPSSLSRLFGALKVGGASTIAGKDQKLAFSHLCQACRDGDLEWARHQITQVGVADINATDSRCLSPLHYAVMQGNLEVVKLLVKSGARVGGRDGQSSAIVYLAVRKNNMPVLRYLLEEESAPVFSACCDSIDRGTFRTPLSLAVQSGQLEAVELLVKHGAEVQGTDDLTLLCAAVDRGDVAMVKLLLQCDAPINETKSTTEWGSQLAALHVAAYKGDGEMVEILLGSGADISVTCKRIDVAAAATGVTAPHLARGRCAGILLRHGAKVFARDSNGQFPLSGAVYMRDVESVRTLLQHGAPVNAQDRKGDTALHIVCRMFARDVVARTSTSSTCENLTCHVTTAEELVDRGANIGSRAAARRIIRTECDKVLRKKTAEDLGRLQLIELMKMVVDIVKAENDATDSGGKKAGIASMSVQDLLAQTTLAHLVTR
ncbi:ankyrin repeat-containing domain protein [Rhypophila decipiens]|uniref:Ankyrin repeat-containing domain protein n=1 Tax=Rhypophila decipiens TaxID=261697 RepID=A0AAN7AZ31_9PEZI|nr:ankyrin repeat-containing domain protein [Rhypophila decipiens]